MASGFISFPIFTRIFTREEYGMLSLLNVTMGIIGGITTLGANRSIIRFYYHYKKQNLLSVFISTLISSITACGIISILLAVMTTRILLHFKIVSYNFYSLLPLALLWMVFQNIFTNLVTTYRLEERLVTYNILGILRKYSGMIAAVSFVLIFRNLYSFYLSQMIVEALLVIILFALIFKEIGVFIKHRPSKKIFLDSLAYGFPLSLSAIASIIFNLGDRYLVAYYRSIEQVAIYAAGYSICTYFKELVITPFNLTLLPLIINLWEQQKIEEAKRTLYSSMIYYYMIAIPLVLLLTVNSRELITLLASEKYIEAAGIMPIIMCGVVLSFDFPFSAGLYLQKNTLSILLLTSSMAIFNIIINCFLVPAYGIKGAAYATLISFIVYIFLCYLLSRKYLYISIPFKNLLYYILASVLSYLGTLFFAKMIPYHSIFILLILKSMIFVIIYALSIFIFDSDTRKFLITTIMKKNN